jgi:hypothetical protein
VISRTVLKLNRAHGSPTKWRWAIVDERVRSAIPETTFRIWVRPRLFPRRQTLIVIVTKQSDWYTSVYIYCGAAVVIDLGQNDRRITQFVNELQNVVDNVN